MGQVSPARAARAVRAVLWHVLNDHRDGAGDHHRLQVVDQGERGYDVVLRIDGGYSHPADAEDARRHWQHQLDEALRQLQETS